MKAFFEKNVESSRINDEFVGRHPKKVVHIVNLSFFQDFSTGFMLEDLPICP